MNKLRNGKYREHETFKWYKDGKLHREDGPAVIWDSGHKEWYQNGVLHREDGPAFEGKNGTQSWYLKGVQYTEEEFKNWDKRNLISNWKLDISWLNSYIELDSETQKLIADLKQSKVAR